MDPGFFWCSTISDIRTSVNNIDNLGCVEEESIQLIKDISDRGIDTCFGSGLIIIKRRMGENVSSSFQ
jgi:hypothetical protein